MATLTKFQQFVEDLCAGVHALIGTTPGSDCDVLKVYLSNATPSASADAVKGDMAEITNENGYTAPVAITNNGSRSGGTVTLTGLSVQITASGDVGPFQWVVLYNDTPTSPADPLIAYADYGSALTLHDGETFDVKFDDAAVGERGAILTVA